MKNRTVKSIVESRRTKLAGRTILMSVLVVTISVSVQAQSRYIDRTGTAVFFSSAPLEDIAAESHQAVSVLDVESGDVVASMLMRSFNFKKALMQEHFNENFVESHKYPKATFQGKVTNIDEMDISRDGTHVLQITGDITVHGVTRPITLEAEAKVAQGAIQAKAVFPMRVSDFEIRVPRLVISNIAEVVEVTVSFNYRPM